MTEAKARLSELVRRAADGEEVVLTRHGRAVARLAPVRPRATAATRRAAIAAAQDAARKRLAEPGVAGGRAAHPSAARSQDFLYDEHGMPN